MSVLEFEVLWLTTAQEAAPKELLLLLKGSAPNAAVGEGEAPVLRGLPAPAVCQARGNPCMPPSLHMSTT